MLNYSHTITAEEIRDLVGTSPLILEIGCHDGTDTAKIQEVMPAATLHCFEPDPRPRQRFWDNVAKFDTIHLYAFALGNCNGLALFYPSTGRVNEHEDWDYSGSLQKPTGHLRRSPEIGFRDPIQVSCRRLDTWFFNERLHCKVDFIWADVQGGQRGLIEGGRIALALTRWLYIECHQTPLYDGEPTPEELVAMLPGFEPIAEYARENILFRNRHFQ